ncbi:MAG: hypothetical protein D6806_18830, partial [Deltaproteobacteria bacterium]
SQIPFCDPLTRTCILGCFLGYCFLPGYQCIDGGCYECATDADCPNTRCDLFDRTCTYCSSDADCKDPSLHCDAATGSCHECLSDEHCPGGRCNIDSNFCVECLGSGDCPPDRPQCDKDGNCIAPCTDECTQGEISCDPSGGDPRAYLECGDYDADECLEFGGQPQQCPANQECNRGACVCADECTLGERRCTFFDTVVQECVEDSNGCLYFLPVEWCQDGKKCSNGQCI